MESYAGGPQPLMPLLPITTSQDNRSCMVDGCTSDLSEVSKYFKSRKICESHARAAQVPCNGQWCRFCQQCGKLEPLQCFDKGKRSCRVQLARRRLGTTHDRKGARGRGMMQLAADSVAELSVLTSPDSLSASSSQMHVPAELLLSPAAEGPSGDAADMARLLRLHQERCALLERQVHILRQQQSVSTQLATLGLSDAAGLSAGDLAAVPAAASASAAPWSAGEPMPAQAAHAHSQPLTYVPFITPGSFAANHSSCAAGGTPSPSASFSAFGAAGMEAPVATSAAFTAAAQHSAPAAAHSLPLPPSMVLAPAGDLANRASSASTALHPLDSAATGWGCYPAGVGAAAYAEHTGSCSAYNSFAWPSFDTSNWQLKQEQEVFSAQDLAAAAADDTCSGRLAFSTPNLCAAAAAAELNTLTASGAVAAAGPSAGAVAAGQPLMLLGELGAAGMCVGNGGDVIMDADTDDMIADMIEMALLEAGTQAHCRAPSSACMAL